MRKYKKEVMGMIDGLKKDFVANLKKQIEEIQKLQLRIEEDIQFQEDKRNENIQSIMDAKKFLL